MSKLLMLLVAFSTPAFAQEYHLNVVNRSDTPVQFEVFQTSCVMTSGEIVTVPAKSEVTEIHIVDHSGSCAHKPARSKIAIMLSDEGDPLPVDLAPPYPMTYPESGFPTTPIHFSGVEVIGRGNEITFQVENAPTAPSQKVALKSAEPIRTARSFPEKKRLKTTRDQLAYIATLPEIQQHQGSGAETAPILQAVLKEVRDFNSHLGIKSQHGNSHDVLADLRQEAAAHVIYTMQYDGYADFPQYPLHLTNDLDQAVHVLQSANHSTGITYENAVSAQQQTNTADQAATTQGVSLKH